MEITERRGLTGKAPVFKQQSAEGGFATPKQSTEPSQWSSKIRARQAPASRSGQEPEPLCVLISPKDKFDVHARPAGLSETFIKPSTNA
jgi:hypothetical protein